jgi:hypothetical protein
MKPSWQIKVSTSTPVPNLFRQTAAALLLAILLSPAVWAAPVQSDRPQTLASADAVPEWSSIRQQYERQRHGDATLQEWFVNDRRGLEHGFTVRERPNHPGANDREVLECASPLALFLAPRKIFHLS